MSLSSQREISEVNKGRKMLEKMGWKKGEGLGKEGTGMRDPVRRPVDVLFAGSASTKTCNTMILISSLFLSPQIQLKIRKSQSGLGAGATMSLDSVSVTKSKSQKNWEKARERFADSCQPDLLSPNQQKNKSPKAWVKGEETETPNTQEGVDTNDQS